MSSKKSIVEIIEENKKTLLAEYQKGYLVGFKEAEKRSIEEFLKILRDIDANDSEFSSIDEIIEYYEKRLKQ